MPIRNKLLLLFILFITLPLFFTAFLSYQWMARETRNQKIISLKSIAKLKIDLIERSIGNFKGELKKAQGYWNIKRNLPILLAHQGDPSAPAYRAAEKTQDPQLE